MLLAIIPLALVFAFACYLMNVLENHGHNDRGVEVVSLGIGMALTLAVELFLLMWVLFSTLDVVGNRRSRARFYHSYRVAPARQSGLHRMSKRRAVAYANAGFSASEAQKLEFGARSERPTEETLMILGALNCSGK